jgi:uncharacterized protein (TIRG00374 family)
MNNSKFPSSPPKIHVWRDLSLLIMLGLAVHLLLPQITSLERSWSVIKGMTWWFVALAAVSQVLSYMGSGFMLRALLEINQQRLSKFSSILITLASSSIGLVAGGMVGSAAATYRWVRRESKGGKTSALIGIAPSLLNNSALVGVALIGIIYLLLLHDLSTIQLVEFCIILLLLGLLVAILIASILYPENFTAFIVRLAGWWNKLRHKRFTPEKTISSVQQFIVAWNSLRNGKWKQPLLGAIASVVFDMLTLYFLFLAAGHNVSLGILFAGYGLPLILGKIAFLIPGGVGVIEGGMVALYDSLKVPDAVSVVVILGYRMFSFWLPTILGFLAALYLSSKPTGTTEEKHV